MLKLIATLLLLLGSSGIGYSMVYEEKKRIAYLLQMREVMMLIQNEIQYGKTTFPEICEGMEDKCSGIYKAFFQRLNKKIHEKNGESFLQLWKECGKILEGISYFKKKDQEHFFTFPTENMYQDKEMQGKQLEEKIIHLQKDIEKSEKKLEANTRVYLCMGIMGGIFLCILFW